MRFPYYFPFHRLVVKKRPRVIYWRPDTSLICPPFIKPTTGVSIFCNRGLYFLLTGVSIFYWQRSLFLSDCPVPAWYVLLSLRLQQGSLFFTTEVSIFYWLPYTILLYPSYMKTITQYNPSKQSATEPTNINHLNPYLTRENISRFFFLEVKR